MSNTYTPTSSLASSQSLQCPAPLQPRNSHLSPAFPLTNSPVKSANRRLPFGQLSTVRFWTRRCGLPGACTESSGVTLASAPLAGACLGPRSLWLGRHSTCRKEPPPPTPLRSGASALLTKCKRGPRRGLTAGHTRTLLHAILPRYNGQVGRCTFSGFRRARFRRVGGIKKLRLAMRSAKLRSRNSMPTARCWEGAGLGNECSHYHHCNRTGLQPPGQAQALLSSLPSAIDGAAFLPPLSAYLPQVQDHCIVFSAQKMADIFMLCPPPPVFLEHSPIL